jgi:hypothetical protein
MCLFRRDRVRSEGREKSRVQERDVVGDVLIYVAGAVGPCERGIQTRHYS